MKLEEMDAGWEALGLELNWFQEVLHQRLKKNFDDKEADPEGIIEHPPEHEQIECFYTDLIKRLALSPEERLVIMLAIAPDVRPGMLDILFIKNPDSDRGYTEFGGVLGAKHSGFLPTIETAYFLLCGEDWAKRSYCTRIFEPEHSFQRLKILDIRSREKSEPWGSTTLRLNQDFADMLLLGYVKSPEFSVDFPAKPLDTAMEWKDLVLAPSVLEQLKELRAWLAHEEVLLNDWKLLKYLNPGYRSLFFGPPGTGKTLTASLLGKISSRQVYRIDLSQLVSKYIGETEKNLELVFSKAEQRNWILFFDEADSIFGKRTQITDSHDRYANQGTSYLLQRVEDCPNVVILASNYKQNIDEAFLRRFQSTVYFPMPGEKERLRLWKNAMSPVCKLEGKIDLKEIAKKYELAGGSIMNVVRYVSLMAIGRGERVARYGDLVGGIVREYGKEGRSV